MTEPGVEEVAMSLCALGRTISDDDTTKSSDIDQSLCDVVAAAAHLCVAGSESTLSTTNGFAIENISSSSSLRIPSLITQTTNDLSSSTATTITIDNKGKKNAAAKKVRAATKHDVRTKRTPQHHRDFSVTLDEMERLMRVYGSLKCLRNRTPLTSGRSTKVESVKRKFYRWFPDLEERFIRTEEGWYSPKAGHEEEIQYREAMRKGDQDSLVKKRNIRRSSSESNNVAPAV